MFQVGEPLLVEFLERIAVSLILQGKSQLETGNAGNCFWIQRKLNTRVGTIMSKCLKNDILLKVFDRDVTIIDRIHIDTLY